MSDTKLVCCTYPDLHVYPVRVQDPLVPNDGYHQHYIKARMTYEYCCGTVVVHVATPTPNRTCLKCGQSVSSSGKCIRGCARDR